MAWAIARLPLLASLRRLLGGGHGVPQSMQAPILFSSLVAAAYCAGACGQVAATDQQRRNVLVITVDGLRADRVGAYGHEPSLTPHLDRLSEESVRYAYALAPAPWAAPSFAALWAGRYPSELGFTDLERPLAGEIQTLPEAMGAAGWETGAVISHPFAAEQTGLDQGFAEWTEVDGSDRKQGASDTLVTAAAVELLEDYKGSPFLAWVQYSGLRLPFEQEVRDPSYQGPIRPHQSRAELLRLAPTLNLDDRAHLDALYSAELAQVDREIGALLAVLEEQNIRSSTVVIVTAPHGCEILERGGIGDAGTLHDEIVRVPFLLHIPGGRSGVIPDPVSLVDLAPTMRRVLELEPDPLTSGLCVLPGSSSPERALFSETNRAYDLRAVLDGDWKLIVDRRNQQSELFDVFDDPAEVKNAGDTRGLMRDRLERELATFEDRLSK